MKIIKKLLTRLPLITICYLFFISNIFAIDNPISTDSRIKTLIYNPNEIFRVVVHYNFQTSIEFEKNEEIKTISTGNSYAWQLTPMDNRLFIKPLEDNILTNMTIITNKRVYQFEVQSKPYSGYVDNELVYVARFYFPSPDEKIAYPEIQKMKTVVECLTLSHIILIIRWSALLSIYLQRFLMMVLKHTYTTIKILV